MRLPDLCPHERRQGCDCGKNWSCLDCGFGEGSVPCDCPPASEPQEYSDEALEELLKLMREYDPRDERWRHFEDELRGMLAARPDYRRGLVPRENMAALQAENAELTERVRVTERLMVLHGKDIPKMDEQIASLQAENARLLRRTDVLLDALHKLQITEFDE